mgnify:FL=1
MEIQRADQLLEVLIPLEREPIQAEQIVLHLGQEHLTAVLVDPPLVEVEQRALHLEAVEAAPKPQLLAQDANKL